MRVSDIQAWSNCETYALQSPPRPADGNELPAPWPQVEIRDGRTG